MPDSTGTGGGPLTVFITRCILKSNGSQHISVTGPPCRCHHRPNGPDSSGEVRSGPPATH